MCSKQSIFPNLTKSLPKIAATPKNYNYQNISCHNQLTLFDL